MHKYYKQMYLKKKGAEFIKDFERLHTDPFWNLVDVADKYGFTKENARQYHNKLYGGSYRDVKSALTAKVRLESELACIHDPRNKAANYEPGSPVWIGAKAEALFYNKCIELGYKVVIPQGEGAKIDLRVNGYKVDIKSSLTPMGDYYRCTLSPFQIRNCDFIAWMIWARRKWYIIPRHAIKSYSLYIRATPKTRAYKGRGNSLLVYKELWRQLK